MKFKHLILSASFIGTCSLSASQPSENTHENQSTTTNEINQPLENKNNTNTTTSQAPTKITNILRTLAGFGGKTETSLLLEQDAKNEISALLTHNPQQIQNRYLSAITERMNKSDLLSTNDIGEWNQDKLEKIIRIGKKYSEIKKDAESQEAFNSQHKLELPQNTAEIYRKKQESLLIQYILEEKNRIYSKRISDSKNAEENTAFNKQTAENIEKSALEAIDKERVFYESKWLNEISSANSLKRSLIEQYEKELTQKKTEIENQFNQEIEKIYPTIKTIAFNYDYFKRSSGHKKDCQYNINKFEHYKELQGFKKLLESLPQQENKNIVENNQNS